MKGMSYIELCKMRIALTTTLSAAAGYLLAPSKPDDGAVVALTGLFLLACGAAALNQYQERSLDAVMERTSKRPLPSGRVRPADALLFSLTLLLGGSLLLGRASLTVLFMGLGAVLWYNGVYTPLKRKTVFAAIPGAVVGALPVAIGWVSGGGNMGEPKIAFLCFFFFMWQLPHFWLLMQKYGDDYRKAGLPSLTSLLSGRQLTRINFVWMSATGVSCILMAGIGIARNGAVNLMLFLFSVILVLSGGRLFRTKENVAGRLGAFRLINIYMVFVTLLLAADKFI